MEKKRRERINRCLEDLKSIVLTSVSEEVSLVANTGMYFLTLSLTHG